MDIKWKFILDRMISIQNGLLRFKNKGERTALLVKVLDSSTPSVIHISLSEEEYDENLISQPASLSQLTEGGYLFVSGSVSCLSKQEPGLFHINVSKAHLFERKGIGSNRWLEEICSYE